MPAPTGRCNRCCKACRQQGYSARSQSGFVWPPRLPQDEYESTRKQLAHGISGNCARGQDYDKILTAFMRSDENSGRRDHGEQSSGQTKQFPTWSRRSREASTRDFQRRAALRQLILRLSHARVTRLDVSAALACPASRRRDRRRLPPGDAGTTRPVHPSNLEGEGRYQGARLQGQPSMAVPRSRGHRADAIERSRLVRAVPHGRSAGNMRPGGPNAGPRATIGHSAAGRLTARTAPSPGRARLPRSRG